MKIITLALLAVLPQLGFAQQNMPNNQRSTEMQFPSPNEDLLQEHAILNRLLFIYDEISYRLENRLHLLPSTLNNTAKLMRSFTEDYHDKLEEEYIFPEFKNNEKLAGLVKALKAQHDLGRTLTDYILAHSNDEDMSDEVQRLTLADVLRFYARIFRAHEAREDNIVFPAFQRIVPEEEYLKIGKKFDERKSQLYGKDGLEKVASEISKIEGQLDMRSPRYSR